MEDNTDHLPEYTALIEIEILQNCSTLLSHMMSESVTLELDKFDHKFCGFMSKA
ncbi:MAG: hypothetical protein ACLU6Y_01435 [Ruminococcus sp.]